MEVVINVCYGGFSLSAMGINKYAEYIGKKAYFFHGGLIEIYRPITLEEAQSSLFFSAFSVPNPNDYLKRNKDGFFTKEANEEYQKIVLPSGRELERNDPILIKVVKELGKEANSRCAELKVIEIPNDIQWHIEDYDGVEHIAENHRTWS
jgi:hypothetical protein